MTPFATTADIRASSDHTLSAYLFRFTALFIASLGIDVILRFAGLGLTTPTVAATMAAYLCTRPSVAPRFRSLSRFGIAVVLSSGLSAFAMFVYEAVGLADPTVMGWVVAAAFYTFVFGFIESLSFWWTCVITPGPDADIRADES